jgi:Uma2 family endonuclease
MAWHLSREEFRRWAEGRKERYERIAGEPVAMSPERARQVRIKHRLRAALDRAVRETGLDCEALGDGITIEVDAETDYEPDVVVNCGPKLGPDVAASNPVVVAEVLSPSTQSIDSSEKLADYFRVPSIRHYLIVRARRCETIHYWRSGSDIASGVINLGTIWLDPPGISIDFNDLYAT